MYRLLVAMAIVLFNLAGCTTGIKEKLLHRLNSINIHIEKSEQLHTIMSQLDNLVYERFYSELDRDRMRIRYTKQIAQLLDDIVIQTHKIVTDKSYKRKFTQAESKEFLSLAQALENDAKTLKDIAQNYKTEELNPTLNHMTKTCNTCHAKFRQK